MTMVNSMQFAVRDWTAFPSSTSKMPARRVPQRSTRRGSLLRQDK